MPSLIWFGPRVLMEVLGSVEPSSPNPRRNTSKDFFEALGSGGKVDTCLRFVSTLSPLLVGSGGKVETRWRHASIRRDPIFNQL